MIEWIKWFLIFFLLILQESYQALYADYIQKADKLTLQKLQRDPSADNSYKYYCSLM
jgi:hypothetical protein